MSLLLVRWVNQSGLSGHNLLKTSNFVFLNVRYRGLIVLPYRKPSPNMLVIESSPCVPQPVTGRMAAAGSRAGPVGIIGSNWPGSDTGWTPP